MEPENAPPSLAAELAEANKWREAVIDALVVSCIYTAEHDSNPRKAINDLLAWESQIALDPAVSSDAQALIDQGRAELAEVKKALAEERERCAKICDEYPLRDPAEDGNGYWAAAECARMIRGAKE